MQNLNPETYEKALALVQNKKLELNGSKPKQVASGNSSLTNQGKDQTIKDEKGKLSPTWKWRMTPNKKTKLSVIIDCPSPKDQKAYMAKKSSFEILIKGHCK